MAVELGAHVEQIPLAIVAKLMMGARLLHRPLEDEIEAGGHIARLEHRLAGAKVADGEMLLEPLTLLCGQAVKRRAGKVEQAGHGNPWPVASSQSDKAAPGQPADFSRTCLGSGETGLLAVPGDNTLIT
ncbi:hypothetical protein NUITMVA1_21600 [Aeromonas hydrophila]|nr:hypothetical protein NUITMVA1_21600 [Aeromonas hydrophila]